MSARYTALFLTLSFSALATSACEEKKAPTPPAAVAPPTAAGQAAAPTPAPTPAAGKVTTGYVVYTTVVKKEPTDKQKVDAPDGKGKPTANWLATLYRGERVTLLKEEGDYQQVKTSGDLEGWIKKTGLLMAPDVSEATVLEGAEAFDRPDLLAMNSKRKVNPGTLLFVLKTKEQFSEVNASGTGTIWVLGGKLTTDSNEIAVAKLLAKARSLKDSKNADAATDLLNLAKNNFGSAKLVTTMETELGKNEATAAAEGGPASAPAE